MSYQNTPEEKKRKQESSLYHLEKAFESSKKDGAPHFVKAMDDLELLKDDYLPEVTAKSVLQDLCDLSQSPEILDSDTLEEVSLVEFQDLVFQKVDMLAGLLGIELEG